MGKRTNLFEINETLAIRKCTKKVFFWYHFSILLFSVFVCVWLGNFTTLVIHGVWIPKKIVKENSCNIVSLALFAWLIFSNCQIRRQREIVISVASLLVFPAICCPAWPATGAASPSSSCCSRVFLIPISTWLTPTSGGSCQLPQLSLHSGAFALPIVDYPPILNWGRDTEQHLHISPPPPPHPTSCFLPRKFSDKFNLSCDRSAACWRWMFDSVISHFLFGRNQNFLPAIGLGAAIPALLALLLHHHPDPLDHRHHPQLPTLSYHHHPHPCYSASAIPTLLTSIIQLRLPHCLPPTSSKRGRGHYGWGNNLKSLSISFLSPISSSSLFSV